ncbi:MAG: decaprenylphospho-beta-D-ribofuranose 2-oxidase, partial [Planctomycetota bacterium]
MTSTTDSNSTVSNTSALLFQDEQVMGFGMSVGGPAKVVRPSNTEQLSDVFAQMRKDGGSVALRGAGCSYGDASTNNNGRVLDMTAMNRILSFDAQTGIAMCEPGVTVRDLWRRS